MQDKTAMRYHHIPVKTAESQNKRQKDGATGCIIPCYWECKMVQLLCKTVFNFLIKLDIRILVI